MPFQISSGVIGQGPHGVHVVLSHSYHPKVFKVPEFLVLMHLLVEIHPPLNPTVEQHHCLTHRLNGIRRSVLRH
jgi:hypothetical protein